MILHGGEQRQYLVFLTFPALYHGEMCGVNEMTKARTLFLRPRSFLFGIFAHLMVALSFSTLVL